MITGAQHPISSNPVAAALAHPGIPPENALFWLQCEAVLFPSNPPSVAQ